MVCVSISYLLLRIATIVVFFLVVLGNLLGNAFQSNDESDLRQNCDFV